jgi:hypothetical protein
MSVGTLVRGRAIAAWLGGVVSEGTILVVQ